AVRDALRHFNQTDLLVGNALLHADLLTRFGEATPQSLKALLADTAAALFVNERDRRLYRVLELTYFDLTLKQEAVAERLGMSFSTYRRHLATSVDRLTGWLWQQEQEAQNAETLVPSAPATGSAPPPLERPRLSIVILPFLN